MLDIECVSDILTNSPSIPRSSFEQWRRAMLPSTATIRDAVRNLDQVAVQIVLVTDPEGGLVGTVSDGDIRRGLLRGLTLDSQVDTVVFRKPLVVPPTLSNDAVLTLMSANQVRQIPVVDGRNHVVGLHLWDQVTGPAERSNLLVIMAGGSGLRMRPHTETCPKPMLPVNGRPMLQHIIERARAEGFRRFVLAVRYLSHIIEDYFGTGDAHGVRIQYLREDSPLGTAGALSLLTPEPEAPLVVTNGDVLTDIRYGEVVDFHERHSATATMAVRLHEWQHPFGVVKLSGTEIVGFEEKPVVRSYINAGVYVLSPAALHVLDRGAPCDMPRLFERLQAEAHKTLAYPMHEPWLDVGRPGDWETANLQVGQRS
jgi:dTDP-glucose pyrophosphorylase